MMMWSLPAVALFWTVTTVSGATFQSKFGFLANSQPITTTRTTTYHNKRSENPFSWSNQRILLLHQQQKDDSEHDRTMEAYLKAMLKNLEDSESTPSTTNGKNIASSTSSSWEERMQQDTTMMNYMLALSHASSNGNNQGAKVPPPQTTPPVETKKSGFLYADTKDVPNGFRFSTVSRSPQVTPSHNNNNQRDSYQDTNDVAQFTKELKAYTAVERQLQQQLHSAMDTYARAILQQEAAVQNEVLQESKQMQQPVPLEQPRRQDTSIAMSPLPTSPTSEVRDEHEVAAPTMNEEAFTKFLDESRREFKEWLGELSPIPSKSESYATATPLPYSSIWNTPATKDVDTVMDAYVNVLHAVKERSAVKELETVQPAFLEPGELEATLMRQMEDLKKYESEMTKGSDLFIWEAFESQGPVNYAQSGTSTPTGTKAAGYPRNGGYSRGGWGGRNPWDPPPSERGTPYNKREPPKDPMEDKVTKAMDAYTQMMQVEAKETAKSEGSFLRADPVVDRPTSTSLEKEIDDAIDKYMKPSKIAEGRGVVAEEEVERKAFDDQWGSNVDVTTGISQQQEESDALDGNNMELVESIPEAVENRESSEKTLEGDAETDASTTLAGEFQNADKNSSNLVGETTMESPMALEAELNEDAINSIKVVLMGTGNETPSSTAAVASDPVAMDATTQVLPTQQEEPTWEMGLPGSSQENEEAPPEELDEYISSVLDDAIGSDEATTVLELSSRPAEEMEGATVSTEMDTQVSTALDASKAAQPSSDSESSFGPAVFVGEEDFIKERQKHELDEYMNKFLEELIAFEEESMQTNAEADPTVIFEKPLISSESSSSVQADTTKKVRGRVKVKSGRIFDLGQGEISPLQHRQRRRIELGQGEVAPLMQEAHPETLEDKEPSLETLNELPASITTQQSTEVASEEQVEAAPGGFIASMDAEQESKLILQEMSQAEELQVEQTEMIGASQVPASITTQPSAEIEWKEQDWGDEPTETVLASITTQQEVALSEEVDGTVGDLNGAIVPESKETFQAKSPQEKSEDEPSEIVGASGLDIADESLASVEDELKEELEATLAAFNATMDAVGARPELKQSIPAKSPQEKEEPSEIVGAADLDITVESSTSVEDKLKEELEASLAAFNATVDAVGAGPESKQSIPAKSPEDKAEPSEVVGASGLDIADALLASIKVDQSSENELKEEVDAAMEAFNKSSPETKQVELSEVVGVSGSVSVKVEQSAEDALKEEVDAALAAFNAAMDAVGAESGSKQSIQAKSSAKKSKEAPSGDMGVSLKVEQSAEDALKEEVDAALAAFNAAMEAMDAEPKSKQRSRGVMHQKSKWEEDLWKSVHVVKDFVREQVKSKGNSLNVGVGEEIWSSVLNKTKRFFSVPHWASAALKVPAGNAAVKNTGPSTEPVEKEALPKDESSTKPALPYFANLKKTSSMVFDLESLSRGTRKIADYMPAKNDAGSLVEMKDKQSGTRSIISKILEEDSQ